MCAYSIINSSTYCIIVHYMKKTTRAYRTVRRTSAADQREYLLKTVRVVGASYCHALLDKTNKTAADGGRTRNVPNLN